MPQLIDELRPILAIHEQPTYLVGGAVRDMLLGRPSHDLDFAVSSQAIKLAFRVGDGLGLPAYILDQERDAARVMLEDGRTTLDFTGFRAEDLEDDLRGRDFTINAMAIRLMEDGLSELIDPCNGRGDLEAGLIRESHASSLADDPVRCLRAVRLAAELEYRLTPETVNSVEKASRRLDKVSIERIRDELLKLLTLPRPERALSLLRDLGLLAAVLPEVAALDGLSQSTPHHEPVLLHTFSVLRLTTEIEAFIQDGREVAFQVAGETDWEVRTVLEDALPARYRPQLRAHLSRPLGGGLDGRLVLRLGALFHDTGKAVTQSIADDGRISFYGHDELGAKLTSYRLQYLRLSNEAIEQARTIVAGHMRPLYLANEPRVSRRAVYRFFRQYHDSGLDICLLALADHWATRDGSEGDRRDSRLPDVVGQLLLHYFEHFEETIQPPMLLNGRDLMESLALEPGPEVGRLLRSIQEAQAAGEISTKAGALALASHLMGKTTS